MANETSYQMGHPYRASLAEETETMDLWAGELERADLCKSMNMKES